MWLTYPRNVSFQLRRNATPGPAKDGAGSGDLNATKLDVV
jgi:hypothetical protein